MSQQRLTQSAEMPSTEVVIDVNEVTKQYDDITAVDTVSFSVHDGEFLTLLGPSGAGKSTILHMIAGFVQPTEGEIYIGGSRFTTKPPYQRDLGLVFQDLALFPHMTVRDNIAFPLKMRRLDPGEIDEKVGESLDLVRLPQSYSPNQINELSGGEQQRVALARALVFNPDALLLDEPLSSLDKKLREEMQNELMRIHKQTGQTIIHVTHNQTEALKMADRIAVLKQGSLEQVSNPYEMYTHPHTPFVADFIGNTALFDGEIVRRNGEFGVCDAGEMEIEFPPPDDKKVGDEVIVGVKTEKIVLERDDLEIENRYSSEIEEVAYEGDRIEYTVRINDTPYRLNVISHTVTPDSTFRPGDSVLLGWTPADMVVY
jgi:putative spermidine/putrescine transport system ATP-binding protein/spermidine/putrescine transport system ATP-binding protein